MNSSHGVSDVAHQIICLPLPVYNSRKSSSHNIFSKNNHLNGSDNEGEIAYIEMDFWTAASLNCESIPDKYFEDEQLNAKNSSSWTSLMYAAYLGHRELCQLLILKGARVEDVNERNQTALMLASSCGAIDVVRILLDFGANCNRQDQYGRSSLHYAVKYYHVPIVQLLLEWGADSNLPDYNDSTPVLAACENGDEKILSYLLDFKGDPNKRNKNGDDAFALAVDEKLQLLLRRFKKQQEAIVVAEPALIEVLCQLGLQKYVRNLTDNGIRTLSSLCLLTEKDLVELGLGLIGPKTKLINYIREMSNCKSDIGSNNKQWVTPTSAIVTERMSPKLQLSKETNQEAARAPATQISPSNSASLIQKKLDDLTKLVVEQRQLNAQCRKALSQIATKGRCTACAERSPQRGSIEELIRDLDRMNARFGSFYL